MFGVVVLFFDRFFRHDDRPTANRSTYCFGALCRGDVGLSFKTRNPVIVPPALSSLAELRASVSLFLATSSDADGAAAFIRPLASRFANVFAVAACAYCWTA